MATQLQKLPRKKPARDVAVKLLTPKQKALADAYMEGMNGQEAAEYAGYAPGPGAATTASRTLRLPHVADYMEACIRGGQMMAAARGAARITSLIDNARSDYVKLQASQDAMDRAGMGAPDKHMHLVQGQLSINIDLSKE